MAFMPNPRVMLKILYWDFFNYMPVVIFIACLDFEQKSSFCKRLWFMIWSEPEVNADPHGL